LDRSSTTKEERTRSQRSDCNERKSTGHSLKIFSVEESLMDDIHSYIIYSEEFSALICRSCGYGLNPNGVDRHIRKWHKGIPLDIRKRIVEWCDGQTVKHLSDIQTPTTEVDEIEGLKVVDGFMCETCNSLSGTPFSIQYHCQKSHGWTISKSNDTNV
jgi:Orsellinic acid/F9775 biosynthesis cluster protein D